MPKYYLIYSATPEKPNDLQLQLIAVADATDLEEQKKQLKLDKRLYHVAVEVTMLYRPDEGDHNA